MVQEWIQKMVDMISIKHVETIKDHKNTNIRTVVRIKENNFGGVKINIWTCHSSHND